MKKKRDEDSGSDSASNSTSDERGLWKGSISFGLVNIPVRIVTAKEKGGLHFTMLDPDNMSPIGYKYYNKATGKDIQRNKTVKGYKYKKDTYVLLSDADFVKANPKATQTLDIEDFVPLADIEPVYFNKAYYLLPQKNGVKAYTLLRDVLQKSGKAAIAKIVMHNKQNLVAIIAQGKFLSLEVLHFADEVKSMSELKTMEKSIANTTVSANEIRMAESLVEDMTSRWKPEKYKDTYHIDIMKRIEAKYKAGKATEITKLSAADQDAEASGNVIDLMPLLKKSLSSVHSNLHPHAKKPGRTKSSPHKSSPKPSLRSHA